MGTFIAGIEASLNVRLCTFLPKMTSSERTFGVRTYVRTHSSRCPDTSYSSELLFGVRTHVRTRTPSSEPPSERGLRTHRALGMQMIDSEPMFGVRTYVRSHSFYWRYVLKFMQNRSERTFGVRTYVWSQLFQPEKRQFGLF